MAGVKSFRSEAPFTSLTVFLPKDASKSAEFFLKVSTFASVPISLRSITFSKNT
jgi:hypothetical protein